MTRRRTPRRRVTSYALAAALSTILAVVPSAISAAASLVPDDAEMQAALRFGAGSVDREDFDAEWRVQNGRGERVTVVTPFHRLVIAGRNAAFKSEELRPNEAARLLREQRDRLVLWVTLKGPREDFARALMPELRLADRTIKAAFVQNERTPSHVDGAFVARCLYTFPVKELTARSRVSLVVRDPHGEPRTFAIDLGAMR